MKLLMTDDRNNERLGMLKSEIDIISIMKTICNNNVNNNDNVMMVLMIIIVIILI